MSVKDLGYEEALANLQKLIEKLEDENLKLDDSVSMFKEAMELFDHCKDILTKAEGEVKMILAKDGDIGEEPFAVIREDEDESY
ncbi:MAG: exodeoxyribonuclease VII small subunit [Gudongella sp.]|jgi:exodeoxyribonuclease VII small subunit|nr:exodeoxyribonuclease VII small subunit [Gudongella sp.]